MPKRPHCNHAAAFAVFGGGVPAEPVVGVKTLHAEIGGWRS